MMSLISVLHMLWQKKIESDVFIIEHCPVLPMARNTLVSMFMETEATDLFFIDDDVGFTPEAAINILEREEEVVAGIYPLKRVKLSFPVQLKLINGKPIGKLIGEKEALVEAEYLPTGFMRIKRTVIEKMQKAYPKLKYTHSVVETTATSRAGYDFFNMGSQDGKQWLTEDYAFCHRWAKIGGQMWVYPNIRFEHIGKQVFHGNYHEHLLQGGTLNA